MAVYLIRHAHAGSRYDWCGDDDSDRPLTARGWSRAHAIADELAGRRITRIVSSPALRCRDTVGPLAERLGLEVEHDERLAEGTAYDGALQLALEATGGPDDVVLCSHGDIIPEVVNALGRRGMRVDGDAGAKKGSIWTIGHNDDGQLVGRYQGP